jgi:hypothetical protein
MGFPELHKLDMAGPTRRTVEGENISICDPLKPSTHSPSPCECYTNRMLCEDGLPSGPPRWQTRTQTHSQTQMRQVEVQAQVPLGAAHCLDVRSTGCCRTETAEKAEHRSGKAARPSSRDGRPIDRSAAQLGRAERDGEQDQEDSCLRAPCKPTSYGRGRVGGRVAGRWISEGIEGSGCIV